MGAEIVTGNSWHDCSESRSVSPPGFHQSPAFARHVRIMHASEGELFKPGRSDVVAGAWCALARPRGRMPNADCCFNRSAVVCCGSAVVGGALHTWSSNSDTATHAASMYIYSACTFTVHVHLQCMYIYSACTFTVLVQKYMQIVQVCIYIYIC